MVKADQWLHSRTIRRLILLAAAIAALAVLGLRDFDGYLGGFGSAGSLDFVQYWSAGRVALDGGNPYDPETLLAMERTAGWPHDEALTTWNPPWTLPLVLPVALLPFGTATFMWLLVRIALVLVSGTLLWRYFAPDSERYWVGLLLAGGFMPALFALQLGQISPWLLAGVTAFLWAEREKRDVIAGAALALLTIKPHLTYLFFLAALWWIWQSGRWRVLVGWAMALGTASGSMLLIQRDIFGQYLAAAANPPTYLATPTLGGG